MKVILQQDVKGQGNKGDLINASDGYARNYLLPRGLAVEANKTNLDIMESRQKAKLHKKDVEMSRAKQLAEKLSSSQVKISAKAGENNKLFGSVTAKDIAEGIKAQLGIDIDKRKINLSEPIKTLGTTMVEIRLYPEIAANIAINIINN